MLGVAKLNEIYALSYFLLFGLEGSWLRSLFCNVLSSALHLCGSLIKNLSVELALDFYPYMGLKLNAPLW